ncbi:Lateral organ boundaries domain family protein [Hibiscus syriacus]|uniref:Lateral organ boundaries domain family protein n=1 Tax=Hibiscus syriacus TaxID=106335 RepID=A0A6A2ZCX6_HIBSY|nr:Lateral organ boundaries domain family protein [Hibiscus syriacus]
MSDPYSRVAQQIALFRSPINNKIFNDDSLRILESVLASNDVKSLFQLRSTLKQFIRSDYLSAIRHIAAKTVDQQLSTLEFFVQAFAIIGTAYGALVLREHKSHIQQWLQVSPVEWLNFAEQSLENSFYAISAKVFYKCMFSSSPYLRPVIMHYRAFRGMKLHDPKQINVQEQAAEYLRKRSEKCKAQPPIRKTAPCAASTLYRKGIKKRNDRKLHVSQMVKLCGSESA